MADLALTRFFETDPGVERLAQSLALAQGFHLHLVLCNSRYVGENLIELLARRVSELRGVPPVSKLIHLFDALSEGALRSGGHLESLQRALSAQTRAHQEDVLWFVDALSERPIQEEVWRKLFERLNEQREQVRQSIGAPLTLLIPLGIERLLATHAPDFWSIRAAEVVVVPEASPLPDLAPSLFDIPTHQTAHASFIHTAPVSEADLELAEQEASSGDAAARRRLVVLLRAASRLALQANELERAALLAERAVEAAREADTLSQDPALDLSDALEVQHACLHALDRNDQALAAARESVALVRRWDAGSTRLPSALMLEATSLLRLGLPLEALPVAQEATSIWRARGLTEGRWRPLLATSLDIESRILRQLRRTKEAIEKAQQSTEIYKALCNTWPDAFRPLLASGLHRLGLLFSDAGRHALAVSTLEESAEEFRRLAQVNPEEFREYLAGALHDLSIVLRHTGHREEAVRFAEEATSIFESLLRPNDDQSVSNLARSLVALSHGLSQTGRHDEAVVAAQRAVQLRDELMKLAPERFAPVLVLSLNSLSSALLSAGHDSAARIALDKALRVLDAIGVSPQRDALREMIYANAKRLGIEL